MRCPKCGSKELKNIKGGYEGCITDETRYGQDMGCSIEHNGKKCRKCGFAFFFGEEFDIR